MRILTSRSCVTSAKSRQNLTVEHSHGLGIQRLYSYSMNAIPTVQRATQWLAKNGLPLSRTDSLEISIAFGVGVFGVGWRIGGYADGAGREGGSHERTVQELTASGRFV